MRPIKLTMSAFGPYAAETVIEMDKLGACGLYLITGDTGAGKTTIFDAITYALFGEASGMVRETGMFRSKYADPAAPTFVELVFCYHESLYTVRRNPEYMRPAKKGHGTVLQKAEAQLHYPNGRIVTKIREVNEAVKEILGIDCAQFTQIAMIAQGDFLKLLLASTDDRKKIFRQIFRTQNYEILQNKLKSETLTREKQYKAMKAGLELYVDEIQCREGSPEWEQLQLAKEGKLSSQELVPVIQRIIDDDQQQYQRKTEELEKTERQLRAVHLNLDRIRTQQKAAADLEGAQTELGKERMNQEQKKAALDQESAKAGQREQLSEQTANMKAHLPAYDELENVRQQLSLCRKRAEKKRTEKEERAAFIESLSAELEQQRKDLEFLKEIDVEQTKTQQAIEENRRMGQQLKGLEEIRKQYQITQTKWEEASAEYQKAAACAQQAQQEYAEKYQAFLDEQAGVLAQSLDPGQPCPVCGSTDHPQPASITQGAPSEEEVELARSKKEQAQDDMAQASAAAGEIKGRAEAQRSDLKRQAEVFIKDGPLESLSHWIDRKRAELKAQQKELKEKQACLEKQAEQKADLEQNIPQGQKKVEQEKDLLNQDEQELARSESQEKNLREQESGLAQKLEFSSKEEAKKYLKELEKTQSSLDKALRQAETQLQKSRERIADLEATARTLKEQLQGMQAADPDVEIEKKKAWEAEKTDLSQTLQTIRSRLDRNRDCLLQIENRAREMEAAEEEWSWMKALSDTAGGTISGKEKIMLETYVQMTYFDRIIDRANTRFMIMSGGQYELKRRLEAENRLSQSGLELDVIDHYNGSERSVKTLSGGESFKASLSLALGLSDEIQSSAGGVKLDTMFVDEGFGSLDEESLQQAIRALSDLTEGNRLVGIISHVADLKEKIDRQIIVKKDQFGGSSITIIA